LGGAWGLYPIGNHYGGTEPLGPFVAFGTGHLVWIADIANTAPYHVWVRRYGGYGEVNVRVDDKPITGGRGGPGGGKYVWRELGTVNISAGSHHVDIDITNCMFDAVLFTPDADYDPAKATLPAPVGDPVIRAPRHYRDDSDLAKAAGAAGIVAGKISPYPMDLNDWLPSAQQVGDHLEFTGAINQYIPVDFAIRALKDTGDLPVSLTRLQGPDGTVLDQNQIDLRIVRLHTRLIMLYQGKEVHALTPDFLVRDDRHGEAMPGHQGGFGGGTCITSIPAHQSRQFHLVVHVPPHSPPGSYVGQIVIGSADNPLMRLPVELKVLPLTLPPIKGWYSAFFRAQPMDKDQQDFMTPQAYLNALKDQVRHGLNTAVLYGGFESLEYVVKAGMTESPCIIRWPDDQALEQVAQAKKMGLPGLLYYGVDEPHTAKQIEQTRNEAQRRQKLGLPMMMAINDREAQKELAGLISNPIYNLKVFDGRNNPVIEAACNAGHPPVSYLGTQSSFPLYMRAMVGLYNTACGYVGSAPWDYYDAQYTGVAEHGDYEVVRFDSYGEPIPTLRWEAWRDGIDDVRYLQALDRAIAAAQSRMQQPGASAALKQALEHGLTIRKTYSDAIDDTWFRYLQSLTAEQLETGCQAMARATIALQDQLK
jgi:hypothetical protein